MDLISENPKRHIVFCGETGVGKSSAINLLLGPDQPAPVSNDAKPCTQNNVGYTTKLKEKQYILWDTRGLGEASLWRKLLRSRSSSERALETFLKERHQREGLNLLVYCTRGSRATRASVKYYNDICAITRRLALATPVVVLVTGQEKVADMDNWWDRNYPELQKVGMEFDDHACITALPDDERTAVSREKLIELITAERHWQRQDNRPYSGSVRATTPPAPRRGLNLLQRLHKRGVNERGANHLDARPDNHTLAPSTRDSASLHTASLGGTDPRGVDERGANHLNARPDNRSLAPSTRDSASFHTPSPGGSVPPSPDVGITVEPATPSSTTSSTTHPSTPRLQLKTSDLATRGASQSSGEDSCSTRPSLFSLQPGTHSSNTLNTECTEDSEDYLMEQLPFKLSTDSVVRRHGYATHRGFYGDVWQCDLRSEEHLSSRKVAVKAVKVCQNGRAHTQSQEKRLRRELRVWLRLDHENIVPLLGIVSDFGPLPSMVSPWYRNGSLSCYLSKRWSLLKPERRLTLLGDIAAGLCHLHDKGVIHGDLHSDNVLIDDNRRARLTDFGLSFVHEFVGTPYLSSSICGAVQFADPALVKRAERSQDGVVYPTRPCDVYSFGGLMLHVLSGRKPYSALVFTDMIKKVSEEERPEIPPEITRTEHRVLMQRCWDSKEGGRPSSRELVRLFAARN